MGHVQDAQAAVDTKSVFVCSAMPLMQGWQAEPLRTSCVQLRSLVGGASLQRAVQAPYLKGAYAKGEAAAEPLLPAAGCRGTARGALGARSIRAFHAAAARITTCKLGSSAVCWHGLLTA